MDKDFEILKGHWQALCNTLGRPDMTVRDISRSQSKVAKVRRFYQCLFVVGLCWIVLSPVVFGFIGLPVIMGLVCSAYFAVMSWMSYVMMSKIDDIDYSTMSVKELLHALRSAMRTKKIQQIAGVCMATPLLGYMLYSFHLIDVAVFYGGVTGLILGLTVGLCADYRVRKTLKGLEEELFGVE